MSFIFLLITTYNNPVYFFATKIHHLRHLRSLLPCAFNSIGLLGTSGSYVAINGQIFDDLLWKAGEVRLSKWRID